MLKEKLEQTRSMVAAKRDEVNAKIDEAKAKADEGNLDEAKDIKDQVQALQKELADLTAKLADLEEIAGLAKEEPVTEEQKSNGGNEEKRSMKHETRDLLGEDKKSEEVRNFEKYLRSKGQYRDGVAMVDAEAVIPIDVITKPQQEPEDVVDLAAMINNINVKTGSGTYPVLANADTQLIPVAELEKNPQLAKPKFTKVSWEVETYRGYLPISQEALDDAGVDLSAIVANYLQQIKRNTRNARVANVLRSFTKKTVSSTDDIKQIFNVDLKQAYNRDVVSSASAFQWLDTLKDKNGQYLLQQNISASSGKSLLSSKVSVVDDKVLGTKAGDAVMFIGDLKRAGLFVNRIEATAKWIDNDIYGQLLQIAIRFDVQQADPKAGYFVTVTPQVETTEPATA